MQRLYQRLSEWASFFRYEAAGRGTSRTVRTETMVLREGVTLLAGSAATLGLDICPLCGRKLEPEQSEQASHALSKQSILPKAE
jgi:hypothetical protein